eukprot:2845334-Alexandrium_andersonii.AAC.1
MVANQPTSAPALAPQMSHVVESLSSEQPSVTGARPDSLEEAQLRQLGIRAPPSFAGSVVALGS